MAFLSEEHYRGTLKVFSDNIDIIDSCSCPKKEEIVFSIKAILGSALLSGYEGMVDEYILKFGWGISIKEDLIRAVA